MRKRSGRPPKYAAVPNETVDDALNLDFMALALLTILLRHRDGWDITLERIGERYGYGREALAKAMGLLMVGRYVVKVRMMSVQGNRWSTEVYVYDTPATAGEVAALRDAVGKDPRVVRSEVIPPTKTALEHAAARRTKLASKDTTRQGPSVAVPRVPENQHSGATCDNEPKSQVGPECRDSRQSGDPAVFKKTVVQKTVDETGGVPSARSAVDVRRTDTSGSSEVEGESGCAAAAEEGSSSDQEDGQAGVPGPRRAEGPELSREQLAAVRAVEAVIPPVLLALLPYQQFPKRNRPAVLAALESRTVDQLAERVARRWEAYGYEPALHDGKMTNPVGAALELIVAPRYCPDLSCEDGVMVDTGADCATCLQRRERRRAARAAGELVSNGHSGGGSGRAPECVICQRPFPGAVPDNGECAVCVREAEAAFAALSARLDTPDSADTATQATAASQAVEDAAPEEPVVDEETARLRAMYARQYGTPDQIAAYCTDAPF